MKCVFTDRELGNIIEKRPSSLAALGDVNGVGPTKVEKYGNEVLSVLRNFPEQHAAAAAHADPEAEAVRQLMQALRQWRGQMAAKRGMAAELIISQGALEAIARVRPTGAIAPSSAVPAPYVPQVLSAGGGSVKAPPARPKYLYDANAAGRDGCEGVNYRTAEEFGPTILSVLNTWCTRLSLARDQVVPWAAPAVSAAEADRQAAALAAIQEQEVRQAKRKAEAEAADPASFNGFASAEDAILAAAQAAERPFIVMEAPAEMTALGQRRYEAWLAGQSILDIANGNVDTKGKPKQIKPETVSANIMEAYLVAGQGDLRRLLFQIAVPLESLQLAWLALSAVHETALAAPFRWLSANGKLSLMGASEENKTPAYAALKLAGQLWTLRENGKLPQPQRAGAAGAGASEHAAKAPRVSFGGAAAPTPSPRERPGSAFGHASPPTAPSTRQGTPTAPPMRQVSSDELYAYITRNVSVGVTEPELLRQFGEGYAKPLAALQEEGEVFYKPIGGQQVVLPL